jgi:hypothetical protein
MDEIKIFSADIATSFGVFPSDAVIKKDEVMDSPLIENRVPEKIFKEGETVKVLNYRVDLNARSKISLEISKDGKSYFADAYYVFGKEIGAEIGSIVSSYMGWLFGNPTVVEQIVNFQEEDASMSLWKESNREFHENLRKVIKVRHVSSKFGL